MYTSTRTRPVAIPIHFWCSWSDPIMFCPSFWFYCQGNVDQCCSVYASKCFGVCDFHLWPEISGPVTISPPARLWILIPACLLRSASPRHQIRLCDFWSTCQVWSVQERALPESIFTCSRSVLFDYLRGIPKPAPRSRSWVFLLFIGSRFRCAPLFSLD
jgi:hypothetical protein